MLSKYIKRLPKHELDSIREECKQTMIGVIYHLIQSLFQDNSEQWFHMLEIANPSNDQMELYLDYIDKINEVTQEVMKN